MLVPTPRRSARLALALLALLIAFSSAPVARAQGAAPGSFAPAECPITVPPGLAVDCGYLSVAESRQRAGSRTIQLAVAIVRSPNPVKRTDPVLFLSGGPGEPALPLLAAVAQIAEPILAERDIVFFDQRGTGYSRPALNCDPAAAPSAMMLPLGAALAERPALLQGAVDALIACGARYRAAGVDLSGYNSVESAADMEDLRVALGYAQWNLYGGSYGTRLGLEALRYRPETIRSAVLDSVYPPQENFHTGVFSSYTRSLNALEAACDAQPSCAAAYPDLAEQFADLVARLNEAPAQLPLIDLETDEVLDYYPFTGVELTVIVFRLFYITQAIPLLPALIGESAQGDYSILARLTSALLTETPTGGVPVISQGMQVAVQCNEDATFASADAFVTARDRNRPVAALAFVPVFNEAMLEICAAWGLGAPSPVQNQAVRSNVPSLLLGGALDPITPPDNAREAAETLTRSTVVIYPQGGHVPSVSSPCLGAVITRFLSDPGARPDSSCLAQEPPRPFLVAP
jgi:pimeloyl-ACP methyl ester carboxylesterase